ncbi:hypothetical protein [Clostridium sardiniense]|uniref:hypothetical protein n=1 Tax=Clostridium sardiniense TaxID=29369 RepID=UPI003D32FD28
MQIVKKDWLYDVNSFTLPVISGVLGFGILSLLFLRFVPEHHELIKEIYDSAYTVIAGLLCMYPIFVIKGICPQMGSDKVYLSTTNLPYSKKQLFFKGLKPWIIVFILYSLIGALINTLLANSSDTFISQYLSSLVQPVSFLFKSSIIQLQIFSGVILALARGIKWYIILFIALILNIIALILSGVFGKICSFLIPLSNNSITDKYFIIGIYSLFILIVFAIAWKDIENIHN